MSGLKDITLVLQTVEMQRLMLQKEDTESSRKSKGKLDIYLTYCTLVVYVDIKQG